MCRASSCVLCSGVLLLAACGSSGDGEAGKGDGEKESEGSSYDYGEPFEPAPPAEGYTRIVAPTITDIPPGGDVTYCQYVMAPMDRDMDILDVTGEQSAGGHHTVAYVTTATEYGASAECTDEEQMQSGFLGGTGGDGAAITLPEGVAFRLPKGSGIVLNNHFINSSDTPVDGEAVLDLKFVEADPARKIAGLFAVNNSAFEIPASGTVKSGTECVLEKDIEFFAISNHMHEYGASATTHITRAGGEPQLVNDVPRWSPEMVGAPQWRMFVGEDTLKLSAGDTVRVECSWENTSALPLVFPREMCATVGMFLSDVPDFRACANGVWIPPPTAL